MKVIILKDAKEDSVVVVNGFGRDTQKAVNELFTALTNDISFMTYSNLKGKLKDKGY